MSSTADTLLCAISSNIAFDFGNNLSKRGSQILTIILGAFAVILSFLSNNILELISLSYGLSVTCLFVPMVVCLLKKKLNLTSAWVSVFLSLSSFMIIVYNFGINNSSKYLIYPLGLSIFSYFITDIIIRLKGKNIQKWR